MPTLNLFPVRVPIGTTFDADGNEQRVLMTPEFSRALSDLFQRVGGTNGMDSDDITQIASQAGIQPPYCARSDCLDSFEYGTADSQTARIMVLQQRIDELAGLNSGIESLMAELASLKQKAADIEMIVMSPSQVRVDWEHPGKIGSLIANTGAFTTVSGSDTTDATAPTAGALKTAGGAAIAKKLFVGTLVDLSTATAGQIKFPATQNASADTSTLDDYKEGTWVVTPVNLTVVNGTGGATYTGRYTKIGNLVFYVVSITVTGTCTTASVANSTTFNLPFTPSFASVCAAVDGNVVSLGNGQTWTNGNAYSPTWSARNVRVDLCGVFAV